MSTNPEPHLFVYSSLMVPTEKGKDLIIFQRETDNLYNIQGLATLADVCDTPFVP